MKPYKEMTREELMQEKAALEEQEKQIGDETEVDYEKLAQVKGEKIKIYKYKSKKNYHRRAGHRQPYTKVEITAINA